jgi:GAF domain-containing protein
MPDDYRSEQARGSEGQPIAEGVAREMSELARTFQAEHDPRILLDLITRAAVDDIPAAKYAGLTLFTGEELRTEAATDPLIALIDQAQYEVGEGPCVQSSREERTVRSDDLTTETRWPLFARRAAEFGIASMLSMQLFVEGDKMGALNLYATETHGFDGEDEDIGMLLAAHAAVAMAADRREANLMIAIDSRDIIGQAKGILMERHKISASEAFDLLVFASQTLHRKLRDIARDLTETGELGYRVNRNPGGPSPSSG